MRTRFVGLVVGVGALVLAVTSCFRIIERDPDRCNAEFPDCPDGRVCYQSRCVSELPDGADRDGLILPDGMNCSSSAACSDDKPICAAQQCRTCMGSGDDFECSRHNPQTPYCNAPMGRCVGCLTSAHCMDMLNPICDPNMSCRPCRAHLECPSRVCKADGSCVPPSDVAVVNKGVMCSNTTGNPYCEIQPALGAMKPYIVVHGHTTPYEGATLSAGATTDLNVTIVGPGRTATPTARIVGNDAPAVSISSLVGRTTSVTLDGLVMTGSTNPNRRPGVGCGVVAGTAVVTIKNSTIFDSGAAGVDSSNCTLTLDGNLIGPSNAGGGVKVTATPFTITNNIIFMNGNIARAVTMDDASDGAFVFNTVANNQSTAGIGGIECGAGGLKKIENSIVLMNTGASQVGAQCQLVNSVTSGTVNFESASNFRLKTNDAMNRACCIDKISNPTTPNAGHDVDLIKRPLGMSHDIGAHEAE
jgi:hypothetical protein